MNAAGVQRGIIIREEGIISWDRIPGKVRKGRGRGGGGVVGGVSGQERAVAAARASLLS